MKVPDPVVFHNTDPAKVDEPFRLNALVPHDVASIPALAVGALLMVSVITSVAGVVHGASGLAVSWILT